MKYITEISKANLPTKYGKFIIYCFRNNLNNKEDIALVYDGDDKNVNNQLLVRMHSECMTGDVFGSLKCDCGPQLHKSLEMIADNKNGILLYLRQEGRDIGLFNKIKAYGFQDLGQDTIDANRSVGFDADLRNYEIAAEILEYLNAKQIVLLTNNTDKINQLTKYGIDIIERKPIVTGINKHNKNYLKTKCEKMGHIIEKDLIDAKN